MPFEQLKLERKRLFSPKADLLLFIMIIGAGILFLSTGINGHKRSVAEKKKDFLHGSRVEAAHIYISNQNVRTGNQGAIKGVSDVFYFLGSLLMLYLGMTAFKSERVFFRFSNCLRRLGLLDLFFLLLVIGFYYLPGLWGVNVVASWQLICFGIYLLFYLNFFYALGLLVRVLCHSMIRAYPWLIITWLILVIFAVGVAGVSIERKGEAESAGSLVVPTLYFHYLETEMPLVQGNNVLPENFFQAVGVILCYTIILLFVSSLLLHRRLNRQGELTLPDYHFKETGTYFILCKDDRHMEAIFRYFDASGDSICIDNVRSDEIDYGLGAAYQFDYMCCFLGVDRQKAKQNLESFDIDPDILLAGGRQKKISYQTVQTIYCAVVMAGKDKTVVIKDFLRGKSPSMERRLLHQIKQLNETGQNVIYLSKELYATALPFEGAVTVKSFRSIKIDPLVVSLR